MSDERDSYFLLCYGAPIGAAALLVKKDKELERLRAELSHQTEMADVAHQTAVHMREEAERLRAEVADQKAAFNKLNEMLAESLEDRERLRARIDAVREIYAGMEGFIAQTAPEGYLQRIVKQMYEAALGGEGK